MFRAKSAGINRRVGIDVMLLTITTTKKDKTLR